jgi:L-rhamnose isomerase
MPAHGLKAFDCFLDLVLDGGYGFDVSKPARWRYVNDDITQNAASCVVRNRAVSKTAIGASIPDDVPRGVNQSIARVPTERVREALHEVLRSSGFFHDLSSWV